MKTKILIAAFLLATSTAFATDEAPTYEFRGLVHHDASDMEKAARRELARLVETGRGTFAEDAAFEMERWLHRRGYANAKVAIESDEEGRFVFAVTEGTRFILGEITVTGSEAADGDDLAAFVTAPTTWILGLGRPLLVETELERARKNMLNFLRQQGYLYAEVRGPFVDPPLESPPETEEELLERTIDVRYEVEDGLQATLASVRVEFDGKTPLAGRVRRRLAAGLGKPFARFTPFRLQSIVSDFYGAHGYPFATAAVEPAYINIGDRVEVEVEITIRVGPEAKLGEIRVSGQERMRERAIRRDFEFESGHSYDSREIRESQRNLFDLGVFRQAVIDIDRSGLAEDYMERERVVVDLDVKVEESDRHLVEFSVGYGSWERIRGSVSYTLLNIDGTGIGLTTELSGSFRGYRGLVRLTDPWLIAPRIKGTLELSREQEERPTFTYDRNTLALTLSKLTQNRDEVFTTFRYNDTDVFDVSGDLPKEFENDTTVSSVTVGIVSDRRITRWNPRSGTRLAASLEWASEAFGGELDFIRSRGSASHYLALGGRWILASRVEFGSVVPIAGDKRIPIQERFFLGGSQSIRSFKQDDVGPRAKERKKSGRRVETDAAAGGEFYSLANVEVRFPLWRSIEGAAFLDVGNIVPRHEDPWFRDYDFGIGGGLRLPTPVGPVRVDAGWNPDREDDEDSWAIFLAVGYPF